MIDQVSKYYNTIKDLKWIQIFYQVRYKLYRSRFTISKFSSQVNYLSKSDIVFSTRSFEDNGRFTFLNLTHTFSNEIDWAFQKNGLLWNYNLNYFDFLRQAELTRNQGLALINNFIDSPDGNYDAYPTSLRIINWIDFISKHNITSENIINSLFSQAKHLLSNLEYHLLGNHLLENAFALFHAGLFFNNGQFFTKSLKIISAEMQEQILKDGGHFELSTMYHLIILNRVLEVLDIADKNNMPQNGAELMSILKVKATEMLAWIKNMTYKEGNHPHFNDSTSGIAPELAQLEALARSLMIESASIPLSDSGYRRITTDSYEAYVDIGQIGPKYIPGHGHSDIGNFEIHVEGNPFVLDTGVSTYEKNALRQNERSTSSHNTVSVKGENQSQVWDGFRVGKKAIIINKEESGNSIEVAYRGFRKLQTVHKRNFHWTNKTIDIKDTVNSDSECKAYIHFHPDVKIDKNGSVIRTNQGNIEFTNMQDIEIEDFHLAVGFNQQIKSKKLTITFNKWLTTKFFFK